MKIPNCITHGIGCSFSLAFVLLLVISFSGCLMMAVIGILGVAKCFRVWLFGREFISSLFCAILGCGGILYIACLFWRNAIPKRPNDADLRVPAQRVFTLTYAALERRMEEMFAIGGDEEVEIDKEARFLSWEDRAMRDIVIQGLGGDDYVAFFWPFVAEDICLSRTQLEELCGRENVLLPEHCREFRPGAVAFCRGGRLDIYPAAAMADFMDNYPLMQAEEDFRCWMSEAQRIGVLDV